ncbi:MAG: hypothetical protein ABI927_06785, partial [Gaiellaceae bacterium]
CSNRRPPVLTLQASAPAAGSIASFCAWLEQSSVGLLVRESSGAANPLEAGAPPAAGGAL